MNTPASKVSCIILAGGEGKRFNSKDKGLVLLDNRPLIEHVINCVKSQVDDIVISANRNAEAYKKYTNTVVPDDQGGYHGPLAGIAACLPRCNNEWVLVAPCDIPALPTDLVKRLTIEKDHNLVVVKAHGRRQLVLLMHASLKTGIDEYLQQGHHKVMTWVELQKPAVVTFDAGNKMFTNLNTPDDLRSL